MDTEYMSVIFILKFVNPEIDVLIWLAGMLESILAQE